MLESYLPLVLLAAMAAGMVIGIIWLSSLCGRRSSTPGKGEPYECGVTRSDVEPHRVSVRFYVVAMLFIIFDLEVAFLYPWATVFRKLGWLGFTEVIMFVGVLFVGLIYAWRAGALEWE